MSMRLLTVVCAALATQTLAARTLAEVPAVVTDTPVVGSLAAQVMGDLGAPLVLLDQGADAHEFQLKPSQAAAVAGADLLFWVGPELTPWLERAISGTGVAGHAVELLEAEGLVRLAMADDHDEGAPHDHAQPAGQDHGHAGHDHGGTDPHAWLNPANARLWLDLIAAELAAADPVNAATYHANAAGAKAGMDTLDAELRATMAPVGAAPVVLFHDAYSYFAAAYGLTIAGTVSESDAQRPGAARISAIRAVLLRSGAVCAFPEANHDPKYIATVAEGTGVKVGQPLDPEGTTLTYGPDLYGTLLRNLAGRIADCVARAG